MGAPALRLAWLFNPSRFVACRQRNRRHVADPRYKQLLFESDFRPSGSVLDGGVAHDLLDDVDQHQHQGVQHHLDMHDRRDAREIGEGPGQLEFHRFYVEHREFHVERQPDTSGDDGDIRDSGTRVLESVVEVHEQHEPDDGAQNNKAPFAGPEHLGFADRLVGVGQELHGDFQAHPGEQTFDQKMGDRLEDVLSEMVTPHDRLEGRGQEDEPGHVLAAELVNPQCENRRGQPGDARHADMIARPKDRG